MRLDKSGPARQHHRESSPATNGGVSSGDAYSTSNLPLTRGKGRQWGRGHPRTLLHSFTQGDASGMTTEMPVHGAPTLYPTLAQISPGLPLNRIKPVDGHFARQPASPGKTIRSYANAR